MLPLICTNLKSHIHLIAYDRLVYREIDLITLTLMSCSKSRASELTMITETSIEMIKHHSTGCPKNCENPALTKSLLWKYFFDVQGVGTYLFIDFL